MSGLNTTLRRKDRSRLRKQDFSDYSLASALLICRIPNRHTQPTRSHISLMILQTKHTSRILIEYDELKMKAQLTYIAIRGRGRCLLIRTFNNKKKKKIFQQSCKFESKAFCLSSMRTQLDKNRNETFGQIFAIMKRIVSTIVYMFLNSTTANTIV